MTPPENIYDKDQNKPIELKVSFNKGRETLELKCQFNDTQDRPEKIRKIGELLKQVSIAQELPPESNCIPHFLLTENDGSEEFYETTTFACGLAGTTENNFENVFFGIRSEGLRNELIAIGEKK